MIEIFPIDPKISNQSRRGDYTDDQPASEHRNGPGSEGSQWPAVHAASGLRGGLAGSDVVAS